MQVVYAVMGLAIGLSAFFVGLPMAAPVLGAGLVAAGVIREFRGAKRVWVYGLSGVAGLLCLIHTGRLLLMSAAS